MDFKGSKKIFYQLVKVLTYLLGGYLIFSLIGGIWFRANVEFFQENSDLLIKYNTFSFGVILYCLVGLWGFYVRKYWGPIFMISICLIVIFFNLGLSGYAVYFALVNYNVDVSLLELINVENICISLLALLLIIGLSSKSLRKEFPVPKKSQISLV